MKQEKNSKEKEEELDGGYRHMKNKLGEVKRDKSASSPFSLR